MKNKILLILFLLLFLIPALYSLFLPGFFLSDDGEWMVIRFSAFYQALLEGQFPVRFLGRLNFGYGYPVANFLYPGFMYLATPLQILGLGFVNSIKILLIAGVLGGGLFTYFWLNKLFDRASSLIGAIVFTYTPYHLFDLYKRGSVGEILSISIVPFILWQLERNSFFFVAQGIFLLILFHNSLAVLFLLFIISYMGLSIYISQERKNLTKNYLLTITLGAGMASFFWIPAFLELKYTVFADIQVSEWQNYFADYNLIGLSTIIIFVIILALMFSKKIKIREHRLTTLMVIAGLISIFLSQSISSRVWNILPVSFMQFPFRLLSITIIPAAFLSAFIVSSNQRFKITLITFFIILSFWSSVNFLLPKEKFDKGDGYYSTNEATTTVKDEYMPKWVLEKPTKHFDSKVEFAKGQISNLTYNSKRIYFESVGSGGIVRINTIYYPGWEAKINGKKTDIMFDNMLGVMEVNLPKGRNSVELMFSETPFRLFADFLSIFSFLVLILWTRKGFSNMSYSQILKKMRIV